MSDAESTSLFPSLALNSGAVPGGLGAEAQPEPIEIQDVVWSPEDAGPFASPIGYALACEVNQ